MKLHVTAALAALTGSAPLALPQVLFVDDSAAGAADGSSWADAFPSLQDALAAAPPGTDLWIAAGTYRPDVGAAVSPGDRSASFELADGVALYGGFDGTETSFAERAGLFDQTVLSGDLAGDDGPAFAGYGENSRHVVRGTDVGPSARLDGLTVTAGHADGHPGDTVGGGGLYNLEASPTLVDVTFLANLVAFEEGGSFRPYGGGVMNDEQSSPLLVRCTFRGNRALDGGGLDNDGGSDAILVHCAFLGNRATRSGGGMFSWFMSDVLAYGCVFSGNVAEGSYFSEMGAGAAAFVDVAASTEFVHCTFSRNRALAGRAGGVWSQSTSDATSLLGCVLWGNVDPAGPAQGAQFDGKTPLVDHSCVQGLGAGFPGAGNIALDPLFVDADGADGKTGTPDDDLRLTLGSPCVDAGNHASLPADVADLDGDGNLVEPAPRDLAGHPRRHDIGTAVDTGAGPGPIVDMGAFELPALFSEVGALSVAAGGVQPFDLNAGADLPGRPYLLLGSASGTSPGLAIDGVTLPLNPDAYTQATLAAPNAPPLFGSFGLLGAAGEASASFSLPAGLSPGLVGLEVSHAFLVIETATPFAHVELASNAATVRLDP